MSHLPSMLVASAAQRSSLTQGLGTCPADDQPAAVRGERLPRGEAELLRPRQFLHKQGASSSQTRDHKLPSPAETLDAAKSDPSLLLERLRPVQAQPCGPLFLNFRNAISGAGKPVRDSHHAGAGVHGGCGTCWLQHGRPQHAGYARHYTNCNQAAVREDFLTSISAVRDTWACTCRSLHDHAQGTTCRGYRLT